MIFNITLKPMFKFPIVPQMSFLEFIWIKNNLNFTTLLKTKNNQISCSDESYTIIYLWYQLYRVAWRMGRNVFYL